MGKAANTNNPRGFLFEGRYSGLAMPTIKLPVDATAAGVIKNGDPLTFVSGEAEDADSGDIMVAVAIGEAFTDLESGDTVILATPVLPDVVFRVQDDATTPVLTDIGNAVDIDSTTSGAYTIDSTAVAAEGDVAIIGIADADDMWMYNEGDEQYRDVLVNFQNTLWNGQAPLAT